MVLIDVQEKKAKRLLVDPSAHKPASWFTSVCIFGCFIVTLNIDIAHSQQTLAGNIGNIP
jgi:hypothetical protein